MATWLAVRILNYPPYEIDWADNSPQRSRCSLDEKDILPSDEDSQHLNEPHAEVCYVLHSEASRKLARSRSVPSQHLFLHIKQKLFQ